MKIGVDHSHEVSIPLVVIHFFILRQFQISSIAWLKYFPLQKPKGPMFFFFLPGSHFNVQKKKTVNLW